MVGKSVLVGKTITRGEQEPELLQFHGLIESVDEKHGFALRRADDGEVEWLPPDLRAFEPAEPGVYTLSSTGEEVHDPDFISIWTVERPS